MKELMLSPPVYDSKHGHKARTKQTRDEHMQ